MSTHSLRDASDCGATHPTPLSTSLRYPDNGSASKDCLEKTSGSDLFNDEIAQSPPSWARILLGKRTNPQRDPDAIATRRSVFDDPRLAPFYWPKRDYENIHRFDPSARWSCREERALLRKIDWKITFMVAVGYIAENLDHSNISQANSAGFLSDLHMTTNDFNLGNTIYRISYLCAEMPSQLISKRIGPDRWIPIQICLWSVVCLSQFWLTGRAPYLACRALLGILQGGFVPGLVLYTSYFYTTSELPLRMAIFRMSTNLSNIIANFLGYGILHLNGVGGKAGWRWLFLIEGSITTVVGLASFFNMPPSATQTKTWFRPKGWLTEREEVIIVNKVLRDDPTKGDMRNREGLSLRNLWTALCDYDLWPMFLLGLTSAIPSNPPATYLTLLLRHAGFNMFNTNLLAIPSEVMGCISMFFIVVVSELVGERAFVSMTEDIWELSFLAALYCLSSKSNQWLYYGLLTGLLSFPPTGPIKIGWVSANSGAVASRTVNSSLYNMFAQTSTAVASQVYRASDAPRYKRGNRILIIVCCINIFVLHPGAKAYYIWRNRQRAKMWDGMTPEEKAHYLDTTKDVGNKRLDFRFAH